jgi:hypothetical protein
MPTKNTGTPSVSPRFALGQVVATPAVLEHLERHGVNASEYLNRHVRGDWGEVPQDDAAENEFAVTRRLRLLSSYTIAGERVWIITEADRSSTCLLYPSEY